MARPGENIPTAVANVEQSEETDIFQSEPEQRLSVALNDASVPDDDSVEVSGEERCHRRAKCRAISNAKSEKSAEPRIPLDASEVTVEAMIPALFVRREIEEEIRDDQRASRNMQEEMLLEAWDTLRRRRPEPPETIRRGAAAVGWQTSRPC
jgi:hypothetical protein